MSRERRILGRFVIGMAALAIAPGVGAESNADLLGVIEFPTSGAAEAQSRFLEGVLYLHNFEYREAADAFKAAQEIDPDFAMAYWGEAMTYNHPLWSRQSRQPALAALRRLGRTSEERDAKARTAREKGLLRAVEVLYGAVGESSKLSKNDRDDLYRDEMRKLHDTYPEDHEIATFYGLSILGTSHEGRDFATYMKAAAVLTGVWDANRRHPGGAHYLIHSYDDPIHAPLGLPMARAYSKIAPGAAHAQHMVSHIFVALGEWDDMVKSNEIAIKVEDGQGESARPMVLGHYPQWLQYGYLGQGRFDAAKRMMEIGHARVEDKPVGQERMYFGQMMARYVIDTEDWAGAERWATRFPAGQLGARDYYFAQAYAAVQQGDSKAAREHLETLRSCTGEAGRYPQQAGVLEILEKEILGVIALEEGKKEAALALAREAAVMESELPLNFGPPTVAKPTYELLGEVLARLGQNEEAAEAFEKQLERTPRRTASLLGLARSAEAAGNGAVAGASYRELGAIWHSADSRIPGYAEAMDRAGKAQ